MAPEFKNINIPVGWNALINHTIKTALVLGQNKSDKSSARTVLELLSKQTEAELRSAIQALGYKSTDLVKRNS